MTYNKRDVKNVLRLLQPHAPLWAKIIREYIRQLEKQAKLKQREKRECPHDYQIQETPFN